MSLALLSLLACQEPVRFTDDADLLFDLITEITPGGELVVQDRLQEDYVRGSTVLFTASHLREHKDMSGWSFALEPNGPEVTLDAATDNGFLSGLVTLDQAGDFTLTAYNPRGKEKGHADIHIGVPDTIVLRPHGTTLTQNPALPQEITTPHILSGGTATFELEWREGDTPLYGVGPLTISPQDPQAPIETEAPITFLDERRNWIQITPSEEGTFVLDVSAFDNPAVALTVESVAFGEVAEMGLYGADEAAAKEVYDDWEQAVADAEAAAEEESGEELDLPEEPAIWLPLVAQAWGRDGEAVYGIEPSWEADGEQLEDIGDLYRYRYSPDETQDVVARLGGLTADATLHASEGFVDSTNEIGACGGSGLGSAALLLPAASLALRRRRRA